MARGVNKVTLLGNLGRDPEISSTQGGTAVAKFSVATTSSRKDKDTQEWIEQTEWHNVVFFGNTVEVIRKYLQKGKQCYIEGTLRTSKWPDKENSNFTHYKTEIIGKELQLLGGQGGPGDFDRGGQAKPVSGSHGSSDNKGGSQPAEYEPLLEDDIPF